MGQETTEGKSRRPNPKKAITVAFLGKSERKMVVSGGEQTPRGKGLRYGTRGAEPVTIVACNYSELR